MAKTVSGTELRNVVYVILLDLYGNMIDDELSGGVEVRILKEANLQFLTTESIFRSN